MAKKVSAKKNRSKKFLVIVESPAKAKTLNKFLGKNYKVIASVGHVRDLPKSKFGIEIEKDSKNKGIVKMRYMTVRGKKDVIEKLKTGVKDADFIYLATDPDREGEAIAWHLFELLKLDGNNTKRISFNEITKNAVQNSIKQARDINMDLVDAQQARRALDRIVGYKISPILWHKIHGGLSAGRVQSVAVKIICDRELERENFEPKEYWSVDVSLKIGKNKFVANFFGVRKDKKEEKLELNNKEDADKILAFIDENKDGFYVSEVKKSSRISKPHPPFITSSLQQEAAKILGFNTAKTMRVAQQLYEGVKIGKEGNIGLISYIRTDSVRVSDEAYTQAKDFIVKRYGDEYLAKTRPVYKIKESAQDAHEAIRPTDVNREPDILKDSLSNEQFKLYKLIWQRFIASQMAPADYDAQLVKILNNNYLFKVSGSVLKFNGYLVVYEMDKEKSVNLPEFKTQDKLKFEKSEALQHFTQPPARFTEATLVKTLEELGIGRPSTYATIISNIKQRNYVAKEGKSFYPTELGKLVNKLLEKNFNQIVSVDFTFQMELLLDKIGIGKIKWTEVLIDFYFPFLETVLKAEEQIEKISISDEISDVVCEKCGRNMVVKRGRYGKFLACPSFPECKNIKPYFQVLDILCPKCGSRLYMKRSRKGSLFYVCENAPNCDFISWKCPSDSESNLVNKS